MMKHSFLNAVIFPLAALALVACDSDDNGGGGGGCSAVIPMQVTGELAPMYSWEDGAVSSLSVARVENIEFIAANPMECVPPGEPDEMCELAYTRSALPSLESPETLPNTIESAVMHGSSSSSGGSFPTEIALTNENPLENGVLYQASVIRTLEDGNVECGCVRFNAGTSADGDDNCL